ncbi:MULTISPECIES: sensor histidine kinase [unclassified Arsukibacterium]|uniref:sensor histidine kinase n=1 Tax=unclassified Arsukibacterium TaxID=2635278 RepID=UPI000C4B6406|nr:MULTISPECIES: HAMP domain-containing sensor histidine kinase [unclassified Arsukibacterium]MAA94671.1 sensor histidine kinase [Rheinheimera sp.]MBM32745.1 sensor histidine kinase [Rheinheimera sp.]|tara:strand:- start:86506 stop:87861 length:1356 start_codon:yes stop_codon:yes gene_type:complete
MSIRLALSLGIICLLLLMALSQIWLVRLFQGQIEQQISSSSSEMTRVVLAQTASQLEEIVRHPPPPPPPPAPGTAPRQRQVQIIEIERDGKRLNIEELAEASRHEQLAVERILAQIDAEKLHARAAQLRHSSRYYDANPLIARFTQYTMLLIAASTALAMLIALWLGHRLIQPLQRLVAGFKQLQHGRLGQQVAVAGLTEYRYVSEQFNQMSSQLAALAAQAEQHQQQQHLAELGEISRGMVHALRNPIHTLSLLLEQVASSDDPELRQRLSEQAEQKMQHINRNLTAMLTLSCADIDRSQQVLLQNVLDDLLLEFSSDQLRFVVCGDSQASVAGAEAELRSIFHTLLANAVEASGGKGQISIDVQTTAQQMQVTICDDGPGLSADIVPRLFSPHCSSKADGAGMGLYISSRLLKLYYQGSIELKNRPQGGCCAIVTLSEAFTGVSGGAAQ